MPSSGNPLHPGSSSACSLSPLILSISRGPLDLFPSPSWVTGLLFSGCWFLDTPFPCRDVLGNILGTTSQWFCKSTSPGHSHPAQRRNEPSLPMHRWMNDPAWWPSESTFLQLHTSYSESNMYPLQTNSPDGLNNSLLGCEHSSKDLLFGRGRGGRWHRSEECRNRVDLFWWLWGRAHGLLGFDNFDDRFWP